MKKCRKNALKREFSGIATKYEIFIFDNLGKFSVQKKSVENKRSKVFPKYNYKVRILDFRQFGKMTKNSTTGPDFRQKKPAQLSTIICMQFIHLN